ncbi:stemmadenine O-acetyltransferase [Trifolium repens]|nr:stemmadenine O-acetyltransferase [Trifolium repens]
MEIELISRETIKPSIPTPSHLRIYPLSFIDNIMFRTYVPPIFFYKPNDGIDQNTIISQLRKSLSHLLSKYYPFAGRLKDKISVECNDQGVSFLVTKIRNKLSEILQNPTDKLLNPLFPDQLQYTNMDWNGTIMLFQINCFECGGIAISICVCHKFCDFTTYYNFMHDWTIINRRVVEEKELLILPVSLLDGGASVFPQRDLPIFPEFLFKRENNVVCKRFIFQPSMIRFLNEEVTSSSMLSSTHTLVVIAWIYKCVVSVMGLDFKTALLNMPVNLRKLMNPPLSEKCVGNIIWFLSIFADKNEIELKDLVCKIKQGLSEFSDVVPKIFGEKGNDNLPSISEFLKQFTEPHPELPENNIITFTSWCRLPIYELDFGWGKPTWFTTCGCSSMNFIILMDTKDVNGIEVVVNLEENVMAKFEHEVELLQYASLNPNNILQKNSIPLQFVGCEIGSTNV